MSKSRNEYAEIPALPAHKSLDRIALQGHRDSLFTLPPTATDNRIASNAASPARATGRTALMAATGTGPSPEFLRTVIAWHSTGHDRQEAETCERNRNLNSEWFARGAGPSRERNQ